MDLLQGFISIITNPLALGFVALGALLGVVIGALPGLTAAAAISMLLPITFHIDPLAAIVFLYVIGKSGRYGGSISAILFNTPGTTASAATVLDGYPLVKQGKAGKSLKMAAIASAFGDTFGELLLIFGTVYIAGFTEKMGPPEYFSVYFLAFTVIGSVIGESVLKGLLSALFGILVGCIGLDPIGANPRFTFGMVELESGITLIPLLIGVFVLSEVFLQAEGATDVKGTWQAPVKSVRPQDNYVTWSEFKKCLPILFRSSITGSFIGIFPGIGSAVAAFVAYGEEKRKAKQPDRWGKGTIEGVAAPESANNAVSGPSMIPLLTLGIPGSTIAAVMVGVFMIHGIKFGPSIFTESRHIIYGMFAAGLLGIAMYATIGYFGSPLVGRIVAALPPRLIYPFIFLIAFIASYAAHTSLFYVFVMAFAGLLGYFMKKFDFSPPAFIISFVLTRGAEASLRQSLIISDSGFMIFLQRPFSLICLFIAACVVCFRVFKKARSGKNK